MKTVEKLRECTRPLSLIPCSRIPNLAIRSALLRKRFGTWFLFIPLFAAVSTPSYGQGYAQGQPISGSSSNLLASSPLSIDVKQLSGADFCAQSGTAFGQTNALIFNGVGTSNSGSVAGTVTCATNPFSGFFSSSPSPGEWHLPSGKILAQSGWSVPPAANGLRIIGTGRGSSILTTAANDTIITACHGQSGCSANTATGVAEVLVTGTGLNYTGPCSISGGGGNGAACVANITSGNVTSITVTNQGSNYTSAPTVAVGGTPGSGQTFTAELGSVLVQFGLPQSSGGKYFGTTLEYTGVDTQGIPGMMGVWGGAGQEQTELNHVIANSAWLLPNFLFGGWDTTTNVVTTGIQNGVNLHNFESNYPGASSDTSGGSVIGVQVMPGGGGSGNSGACSISGGGGSGATCVANYSSGVVTSVVVTNQGTGYTSAPTVATQGSNNASLTAVIGGLGCPGGQVGMPATGISSGTSVETRNGINVSIATVTLAAAPPFQLTPYMSFQASGFANGSHGTVYNTGTNGIAFIATVTSPTTFTYLVNSTNTVPTPGLADSTTGGTITLTGTPLMQLGDSQNSNRGISDGTLNTFGCQQTGVGFPNDGVPVVGEEFSGSGTVVWSTHEEGAINGASVGDLFPTSGVLIGNNTPNHAVTTGIHLSSQWGFPLDTIIINNNTSGATIPTTNNIVDDANGNTLTRNNNKIVPLYVVDNSGTSGGVFTLANPVSGTEIVNGVSVYNGAIDIWKGGTDEIHADNTGNVTAAARVQAAGFTDTSVGMTTSAMAQQTSATCTNVTNMTWNIVASKNYLLKCEVPVTFASSATIAFCLGGPGTPTSYSLEADGPIGASAAYSQIKTLAQTAWGTKTGASGAPGSSVAEWVHVVANIQNGTTGSGTALTLQTAANGTNGITVGANASCLLTKAN